ncbi:helix-turn-helix domain-containing protein [Thiomicrorhabdus sp. Kp2]|uniref:helix-turn-helix domain-containing protein n=1 Tax=Thiomicrorhabdus sp. Kp2 TaxID=1123518 RepID=UPI000406FE01|nr:helix-turn-helix domain-containing protein [Thiomicrorhabdus sp. Kp2]MEA1989011.1 helix-turn-helix domain-containing protein [Pseudomonadota bacterium]
MNHDEIKSALAERGYTLAAACEVMGRSYIQFYNVTNRAAKSFYIANSIAVLIDKPVEKVFPDIPQYSDENRPNKSQKLIDDGKAKLKEAGLMSA